MTLDAVVSHAHSKWMEGSGPAADVCLSTRVRLARNLRDLPFTHAASPAQLEAVLKAAVEATKELNRFGFLGRVDMYRLSDVPPLERRVLVEKHLISPQHAEDVKHKALILSHDETVSIMVNEEDHLRIQCLFPALHLDEAWELASRVDDAMEQKLDLAFGEEVGYLTACPTNLGTGLRASLMVHLPGLVLTNQVGRVLHSASQLGLAVRGLYGEGTDAAGNIFQVSNQVTLGRSEQEIVAHLKAVVGQIINQERSARQVLQRESKHHLEDRIFRSYGVLRNARIMTSEEAMKLFSDVRLGVDLGFIDGLSQQTLNEFLVITRPAYLQKQAGHELTAFDRDVRRAELIRARLRG